MEVPFSVLITVYDKANLEHFKEAIKSIFEQTMSPKQVVLVVDGKINNELEDALLFVQKNYSFSDFKIVRLPENLGAGGAASAGLKYCTEEYVARMDSDDISSPTRFEKQFAIFNKNPELDVVGSVQYEFSKNIDEIDRVKKVPEFHDDIAKALKWRNVIAQPSLVIKKQAIDAVGGYNKDLRKLEDYDLFVRMVVNGSKFYMIQDKLYFTRVLPEQRVRRGGLDILCFDWIVRYNFYKIGFISFPFFVFSSILYSFFRLTPSELKPFLYRLVRSKK